jgi:hypothetical protein
MGMAWIRDRGRIQGNDRWEEEREGERREDSRVRVTESPDHRAE